MNPNANVQSSVDEALAALGISAGGGAPSTGGVSIAGGGTISVSSGKTGTFTSTLTLSGTDGTTFTFPSASDTIVGLAATQTLSNKTLSSPAFTGSISGLVGIGAAAVDANLQVYNGDGSPSIAVNSNFSQAAYNSVLLKRSNGSRASPTTLATNDRSDILWQLYDGGAYRSAARVAAIVNGTVSSGVIPTDLVFETTATNGTTEKMRISSVGAVSVTGTFSVSSTSVFTGGVGFYGAAATTKQTVSGSRGGNAALASLITALATYGIITDSSS